MILTDFRKALDSIDHKIFLLKIPFLGFSREIIDWCKSYLPSRKFHVKVDDKVISTDLLCGVPQGSILRPLLSMLYINDMRQVEDCDQFLYTDDICLLFQHKDLEWVKD